MKTKKLSKRQLQDLGYELEMGSIRYFSQSKYEKDNWYDGDEIFKYEIENAITCCGVGEITCPEFFNVRKFSSQAVEWSLDNEEYAYLIAYLEVKAQAKEIKFLKTCGFKQIDAFYNPRTQHDLVVLARHKRTK